MLALLQSLHWLLMLLCSHMPAPPQSLQVYLLCSHFVRTLSAVRSPDASASPSPPASRLPLHHRIVGLLPRQPAPRTRGTPAAGSRDNDVI